MVAAVMQQQKHACCSQHAGMLWCLMHFTLGVITQAFRTACVCHEHAHVLYKHEHGLHVCEPMIFIHEKLHEDNSAWCSATCTLTSASVKTAVIL